MNDDDTLDEILLDIARAPEMSLAGNADPMAGAASTAALPQIDGFELHSLIGRGGMGVVYKARQLETERLVAVKVVHSRFTGQGDELRRFDREVKTLGRLRHPRIAPLFAAGRTSGGQPYFAMELVDGITLDRFAQAAPELETRLELFLQICDAVAYSHQFGVIHRDLKPGNILVDPTNRGVKLLDFGLARVIEPDGENSETMTRPQALQGTLPYMSPEQARGQAIATLSDVYSLGVILYELVAGRRPYEVPENLLEAVHVIGEHKPKPPSHFAHRGTPRARDLDAIVLKALEKEPSRRYQSVAELAQDIENYRARLPVQPRRIRSRMQRVVYRSGLFCRRHLASVLLGTVAVSLIVSVLAWSYQRVSKSEADSRQRLAELYTELGRQHLLEGSSAKSLAFFAESYQLGDARPTTKFLLGEAKRTFYRPVATIDASPAPSMTFSPDGTRLALTDWNGRAMVFECPSGRLLGEFIGPARPTGKRLFGASDTVGRLAMAEFTRDGKKLITRAHTGNAKIWDVASGKLVRSLGSEDVWGARIAANGSAVVTAVEQQVEVWNPDSGERVTLIDVGPSPLTDVIVSPDGTRVLTRAGDGLADDPRLWDATTGKPLATLNDVERELSSGNFSQTGSLLVLRTRDGMLQVRDASTGSILTEIRASVPTKLPDRIELSHDGTRVVTSGLLSPIRAVDPRTGGVLTVYRDQASVRVTPIFSPDDSLLAAADGDGRVTIFDAGSGQALATYEGHSGVIYGLEFSADGKWLATTAEDKTTKIWQVQTQSPVATLGPNSAAGPSKIGFSPDGRCLLILAVETGKHRVWDMARGVLCVPLSQQNPAISSANFSPDGARIATSGRQDFVDVWDARSGALLEEIRIESSRRWQWSAFSRDGEKLLVRDWDRACIWNLRSQHVETCVSAPRKGLLSEAISSPDGSRLFAFESWSSAERAWWVETGRTLSSHGFHWGDALPASRSPLHEYGMDAMKKPAILFDVRTGQSTEIMKRVTGTFLVLFSPTDSQVAIITTSGRIELRDASDGKVQAIAQTQWAMGVSTAFSPDGTRLAIGTLGEIDFVDTRTGVRLASIKLSPDPTLRKLAKTHAINTLLAPRSLVFSPDGTKLAVELASQISIWDVALDSSSPEKTSWMVRCEVPWRLEHGQLTQVVPGATECAEQDR